MLVVLAFHAFPGRLRGGFIGVDVFFVISGYLITGIMLADAHAPGVGLLRFYDRRIRRLFPALSLVLVVTASAGALLLLSDEFRALGRHLAAGAAFVSNLVLAGESGYFDEAAERKLLLHLWSLAIEEQFYLVWPLLIVLLRRARRLREQPVALARSVGWMAALLGLGSLAFSLFRGLEDGALAYYSPVTRAWELLLGAWLATRPTGVSTNLPRFSNAELLAWSGALLLLLGLMTIHRGHAFPGWRALLPVLGTALLLRAGPQAWLSRRLLASRPVVFVGLISYPLYLWHWPLLAFAHTLADAVPPWWVRLAALGAAGVLAWLTWRWVEQPVRRARAAWIAAPLLGGMLLIGMLGWWVMQADGVPQRPVARTPVAHPGDIGHERFDRFSAEQANFCRQDPRAQARCFRAPEQRIKPVLALLGDSHAAHLAPGLAQALPGRNIIFFDTLGLPTEETPDRAAMIRLVADDPRIDAVIITAAWSARLGKHAGPDVETALRRLVEQLAAAGRRVLVLEDVPIFSFSPRRCQYRDLPLRPQGCEEARARHDAQRDAYRPWLVAGISGSPAMLLSPAEAFCDASVCRMQSDGLLLYRDDNHLGVHGTRFLAAFLIERLPWLTASR